MSASTRGGRLLNNVAGTQGSWASSPSVRRTMQSNRKWNTKPELVLRRALHAMGLRYRIHSTPGRITKTTADIVFPTERVVIFVDGCFWHGCTLHTKPPRTNSEYWGPKIQRNRERDVHTDRLLTQAGWLPIRVWEHDDPIAAALMIAEAVTGLRTKLRVGPH